MEILYNELYKIFVQELININIGHLPDKKALFTMNELINAIDYIEHGNKKKKKKSLILLNYKETLS